MKIFLVFNPITCVVIYITISYFLTDPVAHAKPKESSRADEVQVEKSIDFSLYLGKWYEIAKIPHSFQKQCVKNTTAEYSLTEGIGKISVQNSCKTKLDETSVANGQAKVVDESSPAKLRVTFVKFFNWIYAFGGDYWILKIGKDYKYSVVGHPSRKYAWILSRTPQLSLDLLEEAALTLKEQGYDLCHLNMTDHDGVEVQSKGRLCDHLNLNN